MNQTFSDNSENNIKNIADNDVLVKESDLIPLFEKAWRDNEFKNDLLQNPMQILKYEGINVAQHLNIIALAETSEKLFLVIPNEHSQRKNTETLLNYICNKDSQDKEFKQTLIENSKKSSENCELSLFDDQDLKVSASTQEKSYL